jgi:hypothetical protein
MRKLKLSKFLAFSFIALSGLATVVAHADEEQSFRAGQALAQWLDAPQEAPLVDVAPGSLIIYRRPDAGGLAARLKKVARWKNYLFTYDEYGNIQVVPYFTKAGARDAYNAVVNGASVDVANCLEQDGDPISSTRTSDDPICYEDVLKMKVSCGETNIVPIAKDDESRYSLRNIAVDPIYSTFDHCRPINPHML